MINRDVQQGITDQAIGRVGQTLPGTIGWYLAPLPDGSKEWHLYAQQWAQADAGVERDLIPVAHFLLRGEPEPVCAVCLRFAAALATEEEHRAS